VSPGPNGRDMQPITVSSQNWDEAGEFSPFLFGASAMALCLGFFGMRVFDAKWVYVCDSTSPRFIEKFAPEGAPLKPTSRTITTEAWLMPPPPFRGWLAEPGGLRTSVISTCWMARRVPSSAVRHSTPPQPEPMESEL